MYGDPFFPRRWHPLGGPGGDTDDRHGWSWDFTPSYVLRGLILFLLVIQ